MDFKSKFIEWAQKERKEFSFEMLPGTSGSNEKQFTIQLLVDQQVMGTAQHISKKRAEQMVAEHACMTLGI